MSPPVVSFFVHDDIPGGPADLWNHWSFEPGVLIGLCLLVAAYTIGLTRLWRRAGAARGVTGGWVAAFAAGVLCLGAALVSPLDPLSDVLFSAHMVQHLLLVVVAAPLLVLGGPEVACLWALPASGRAAIGHTWQRLAHRFGRRGSAQFTLGAVFLMTIVLWAWHLPALYDLAVGHEAVHAAEHVTFLVAAVTFWSAVLRLRPGEDVDNGLRIVSVFAMALQGSILGALITFSDRVLYESHATIPVTWRIGPATDQQLAGLIMWVPPGLIYVGAAAFLFVRWLGAVQARAERGRLPPPAATGRRRS